MSMITECGADKRGRHNEHVYVVAISTRKVTTLRTLKYVSVIMILKIRYLDISVSNVPQMSFGIRGSMDENY